MKFYEISKRILQLHENDKACSVEANAKLDPLLYGVTVDEHGKIIAAATEVFITGASVEKLAAGKNGCVTIYSGNINNIKIVNDGTVFISDCECSSINIGKGGCLRVNPDFLKKMQNMILNFEPEAILYVLDKSYPYRNYNDPHEFINGIIHPKLVYNPHGSIITSASVFVKDALGLTEKEIEK